MFASVEQKCYFVTHRASEIHLYMTKYTIFVATDQKCEPVDCMHGVEGGNDHFEILHTWRISS